MDLQKIKNSLKGDINGIYNGIDVALGGTLSLIKTNIINASNGYIDSKFKNLIIDLNNNDIGDEEFLTFINNLTEDERSFLYLSVQKTFNSKDPIKVYLIGKLLSKIIRKEKLNYFEEGLFANMDTFTRNDFDIIFEVLENYYNRENIVQIYSYGSIYPFEIVSILKFTSIGLIYEGNGKQNGGGPRTTISLTHSEFTENFLTILKNFYQQQKWLLQSLCNS